MRLKKAVLTLMIVVLITAGIGIGLLTASLPSENGEISLPNLSAKTRVKSDALAVPSITADNRVDAFRTLGYLHARDRLFQMELMRRKSAGRLAELFGSSVEKVDRKQRTYQLTKAANHIVEALSADQRLVLKGYVDGINHYIEQTWILPPEFLALQFRPERWNEADSLLVALGMFQNLNGQEQDERMLGVMEQALPKELVLFLTPDTDIYSTVLVGGKLPGRLSKAIPTQAFVGLPDGDETIARNSIQVETTIAGSNNWVVSGSKTADGRAIVANDMHLGLSVPNVWYRANLHYQQRHIYGVTLPGVPTIVVGGNDYLAWGFTNATADLLDLIKLEINPDNPAEYRTPQGWVKFSKHTEKIHIKDAPDSEILLQDTLWGPVSEQPLLGQPVVVKWAALEKHAVDFGLLEMDQAQTVQQAIKVMNHSGGPPQNVVIADKAGHIGWTYMGRFPKRVGFDGLSSRVWADGRNRWDGFIPPDALPKLVDPPAGFIVTANNRTVGKEYPYTLGYNWGLGYRAFRVAELLRDRQGLTEHDLFAIQLDTRSAVFDFYQQLLLGELKSVKKPDALQQEVQQALESWDGYMHTQSIGAAFLSEFRNQLAKAVFAKVLAAGRQYDPHFNYAWREMETPLRTLLLQRPEGILSAHYQNDWGQMILQAMRLAALELHKQYPKRQLTELTWGETHRINIQHPFSKAMPFLAGLLDMPAFDSDGCLSVCVKVMGGEHGASERFVLSPQHPENGIFQMPGGQSGHPFSTHYRDQQSSWQNGIEAPMQSKLTSNTLNFVPQKIKLSH